MLASKRSWRSAGLISSSSAAVTTPSGISAFYTVPRARPGEHTVDMLEAIPVRNDRRTCAVRLRVIGTSARAIPLGNARRLAPLVVPVLDGSVREPSPIWQGVP